MTDRIQPGDPVHPVTEGKTPTRPGPLVSARETAPAEAPAPPVPDRIVFRDLLIFQLKLALDGVGDLVLAPLSLFAFFADLLPGRESGKLFYRVLRLGERWDRWLSLYRPSHEATLTGDGLLGASQIDADTFLGKVEEVVRRRLRSESVLEPRPRALLSPVIPS